MTRKLLIFFAVCAMISIVSLGIATWMGFPDEKAFETVIKGQKNVHWHMVTSDDADSKNADNSPKATKDYLWNGSDALTVNIPATISYEKADTPSIRVEARENLHKILRIQNGTLDVRADYHIRHDDEEPHIIIRGPKVPTLTISSVANVTLDHLNQDALDLTINGAASVEGSGRVQHLKLLIGGAASADFEDLAAQDIDAEVNGAGSVDLRGSRNVDVQINGAGSVTLHQKPTNLQSRIMGFGAIDRDY